MEINVLYIFSERLANSQRTLISLLDCVSAQQPMQFNSKQTFSSSPLHLVKTPEGISHREEPAGSAKTPATGGPRRPIESPGYSLCSGKPGTARASPLSSVGVADQQR